MRNLIYIARLKLTFPRFWSKVDMRGPDECWEWTGALYNNGYGAFRMDGKTHRVHRVAYELAIGPIPTNEEAGFKVSIDHVRERGCTSRACCNPAHLEMVSQRENLIRGDTLIASNVRKTHCIHGHKFTPANTMIQTDGSRKCRACDYGRHAAKRRAAGIPERRRRQGV